MGNERAVGRGAIRVGLAVAGLGLLGGPASAAPLPPTEEAAQDVASRPISPQPPARPAGTPLDGVVDPAAYRLGPGDRLLVSLWGLHDMTMEVEVNAEGRLFVPRVGVFDTRGLTLQAAREAVEGELRRVYPRLRGGVTLVRPRTFLIHVAGAVARPGAYEATPLTRVSGAVDLAGGALPSGSLRTVEVRGVDGRRRKADLQRFRLFGERESDPQLLDGDTIYVPLRGLDVEVDGGVRRPGRYELVAGHDVAELLELAGGLAADAARDAPSRVTSRDGAEHRVARTVSLTQPHAPLSDGDFVHVPKVGELRRQVTVQGAVVGLPGTSEAQRTPALVDRRADAPLSAPREVSVTLSFVDGDRVTDLLVKAGGLQPWADPVGAFLLRDGAHGARQRVALDLPAITSRQRPDVDVREGDTLVVPSRRDSVMVSGAVQRPGLYQYSPDLHPADYITLAGGPTRTGSVRGARVLAPGWSSRRLAKVQRIEPGETIMVPEQRITAAEWIQMGLVLSNLLVGTTAIVLSQVK